VGLSQRGETSRDLEESSLNDNEREEQAAAVEREKVLDKKTTSGCIDLDSAILSDFILTNTEHIGVEEGTYVAENVATRRGSDTTTTDPPTNYKAHTAE
jgi:hypothetical protein